MYKKIISVIENGRLSYMRKVAIMVQEGSLSVEDGICLINEFHGSIVLRKEHFAKDNIN